MAGAKFIVIYPRPTDIEAFEKVYQDEHVPMAVEKLVGKTKFVATKVVGSPQGTPPFYRIAEIHFPSIQALVSSARVISTRRSRREATLPILILAASICLNHQPVCGRMLSS